MLYVRGLAGDAFLNIDILPYKFGFVKYFATPLNFPLPVGTILIPFLNVYFLLLVFMECPALQNKLTVCST